MANKKQVAQEIVNLMSRGGAYPGSLWVGKPMTADEVLTQVEEKGFLNMENGRTANSLEMQNTRKAVSRRIHNLKAE
jgi:hypothetical protein